MHQSLLLFHALSLPLLQLHNVFLDVDDVVRLGDVADSRFRSDKPSFEIASGLLASLGFLGSVSLEVVGPN